MRAADVPILSSPDNRIEMSFAVQASGQLTYAVRFRGKPVLDASKLGLDLEGAEVLGSEVTIAKARSSSGTDDYTLTNTKVSKVHEDYSALTLHVIETGRAARAMNVEARAYNSGIAFRYLLPAQQAISYERLLPWAVNRPYRISFSPRCQSYQDLLSTWNRRNCSR